MQHEAIDGLVLRVRDMGEGNRYLSVLTAERGRISLLAKGSRSMRGTQMSVSQLYSYANFEYYRRGDINILKGGTTMQSFYALSADLDRLNLAAYLCDLTAELTDEGEPAEEILRLLLNALYALSRDLYPQELIKGAFEMRIAALSGYAPDPEACSVCGAPGGKDAFYLDVMNGALLCSSCLRERAPRRAPAPDCDELLQAELLLPLSDAVLAALRYVISAPISRIFSFELKELRDLCGFAKTAEAYILAHLGRGFESLHFYRTLREGDASRIFETTRCGENDSPKE